MAASRDGCYFDTLMMKTGSSLNKDEPEHKRAMAITLIYKLKAFEAKKRATPVAK